MATGDHEAVNRIEQLFFQNRLDTERIAHMLNLPEATVEQVVNRLIDRRRLNAQEAQTEAGSSS